MTEAQGRELEGGCKGRKGRRKRMVAASEVKEERGEGTEREPRDRLRRRVKKEIE